LSAGFITLYLTRIGWFSKGILKENPSTSQMRFGDLFKIKLWKSKKKKSSDIESTCCSEKKSEITTDESSSCCLVCGPASIRAVKSALDQSNADELFVYGVKDVFFNRLKASLCDVVPVTRINRNNFVMPELIEARGKAYEYIEAIYSYLVNKNKVPLAWAEKLYSDNEIGRIFKRQLLERISEWLEIDYIARCCLPQEREAVVLVGKSHYEINRYLSNIHSKKTPYHVYMLREIGEIVKPLKFFFQTLIIPLYILSRIRQINSGEQAIKYKDIAIRIHRSIRRESHPLNHEGYDALVPYFEKQGLTYMFVIESNPVQEVIGHLQSNSRDISDLGSGAFRAVSTKYLLKIVQAQATILIGVVPLFLKSSFLFYDLIPKVFFDYYRWLSFVINNKPSWYCSFNNEGKDHVTRNIVLQNHGIKTFCYSASWSDYYYLDNRTQEKYRIPGRAFSLYDAKGYICGKQREYDATHGIKINGHVVTGVLSNPCSIESYPQDLAPIPEWKYEKKKIVSLFTTSGTEKTLNSEENIIEFLRFTQGLLDDSRCKEFVFILKPKKTITGNGAGSKALLAAYENLCSSPRVIDAGTAVSSSLVIGLSDFVVSMAFTSPTLDALSYRVPACFFMPKDGFDRTIFHANSELLVSDSDQALNSLDYFSNLSESDFDNYYTQSLPLKCIKMPGKNGFAVIAEYVAEEQSRTVLH
jgi:hypothetical protein